MTEAHNLIFGEQLRILIDFYPNKNGQPDSITHIAEATDISVQTLLNLLDGTSASPRLDTARRICEFYGISLDYFDCETEAECRDYLVQQRVETASPIVHQIERETDELSQRGKHNILSLIEWVRRRNMR